MDFKFVVGNTSFGKHELALAGMSDELPQPATTIITKAYLYEIEHDMEY